VIQGLLDLLKVVMRFQDTQESDIFITENEQSIICGSQQMAKNLVTINIQKHYLLSLTRFHTMKYQRHHPMLLRAKGEELVDSFEAYQKSLILKFLDHALDI